MRIVLDRVSLRVKLVAAVLAIVAAALTGISVASVAAMRGYLLNRVDNDLHYIADQLLVGEQVTLPSSETAPLLSPYVLELRLANGEVSDAFPPKELAPRVDSAWPKVPSDPEELKARQHQPYTVDSASGGARWRVLVEVLPNGEFLVVGTSLGNVESAVERLSHLNLLIGLMVLAAAALIAVIAVWASLRPLGEIERTAAAIAAGDLSRRVPDRDPRTEVGRLARVLNMMFNQIETAFRARARSEEAARSSEERMRRFVADASHELRSPLTSIRGFAELHRHGGISDPEEVAAVMRRIEDEASRMGLLVEDLLLLARLDQQRPIEWRPVDLLDVAADAVDAGRAIAPDRTIELVVRDAPVVLGDQGRLRQVLDNLVRNALIHTPPGTPVEVRVRAEVSDAVLEVADEGPGLDPEQAERVFERFYRADPARSRRHGSTGLGLAIVAALAAAHGGRAGVASTPGQGAIFWVRLPLAPQADLTAGPESRTDSDTEPESSTPAPPGKPDAATRSSRRSRVFSRVGRSGRGGAAAREAASEPQSSGEDDESTGPASPSVPS